MPEVTTELSPATRQRLNLELARRMGWKLVHHGYGISPDEFTPPQPRVIPDFFADHWTAQTLVRWLGTQDDETQERFAGRVCAALSSSLVDRYDLGRGFYGDDVVQLLLATPAQITWAVCGALNLSLEDGV